jgi:methionyl-tRNA synthetase
MIYLKPVLPEMAAKSERFFQEAPWRWEDAARPLLGTTITPYEALATRLDAKAVARLIEADAGGGTAAQATANPASKPGNPNDSATAGAAADNAAAAAAPVSLAEFTRVDLRVARILSAEFIPGADKLLKLRVDLGELGEREIFAGIRAAYDPAGLVGRLTVVVANLEPRKMRFGTSAGMVLAAGPGGKDVFLLAPDSGAAAGMRVK